MGYPKTIDNGHGERLTFVGLDGDHLLVESTVEPGAGPPMHVHWLQTERMRVESGRMGVSIPGQADRFYGMGEMATFKPGVEHRFWNAGDEPLHLVGEVFPAHNLEYFLSAVYASIAESRGGRPGAFDAAYLLTRYRSEFAMTAIPPLVRRFVLPLQARVGRLLGRYGKFSDAPDPVVREAGAKLARRSATSARSSAG
ncbi:cupin domain-containing protein [Solirubrobacter sp. CPCC 204708]|uniref:Cupin domain-containing protein n=1 Tax=Solirubrobacter deserti TaxID=2282478 RepID=A0ABT4RET8_9ACTN|nr:cupin domain-containing protein [Solirubrobacter deserti]MBE2318587.1 cupin domain-containing protein [Solirubrobacter deserti]MDA0137045.1 cupin domain-containing protein [Solirubrobacter deserti]